MPDDGAVDSTSEFSVVVALRLGRHRVLMGAEIDCAERGGEEEGRKEFAHGVSNRGRF